MNRQRYNTLLSLVRCFFTVNDILRSELDQVSIEEHGKSLDAVLKIWAEQNSDIDQNSYIELVDYLKTLTSEPNCISDMEEMYNFIYSISC